MKGVKKGEEEEASARCPSFPRGACDLRSRPTHVRPARMLGDELHL